MAAVKSNSRGAWTPERKQAIVKGRAEHKAVSAYLTSLQQSAAPSYRRKKEFLAAQLRSTEEAIPSLSPLQQLVAHQRCIDLRAALARADNAADAAALEAAFVEVAASFSARQGISYQAWRAVGVPPAVLKRAGIVRSS